MKKFKEFFKKVKNAGYTHIVFKYSGSGDSGFIDEAELVKISRKGNEEKNIAPEIDKLFDSKYKEELINIVYDQVLNSEHSGWENEHGAFGQINLELATGAIKLQHYEIRETSHLNESEYNFYKLLNNDYEKIQ